MYNFDNLIDAKIAIELSNHDQELNELAGLRRPITNIAASYDIPLTTIRTSDSNIAAMTGFDINKFIRKSNNQPQPVLTTVPLVGVSAPFQIQSNLNMNNGINQPIEIVFPEGYDKLSQYEKGSVIYNLTRVDGVPKVYDPYPNLTLTEKVDILKKIIDFIPNYHAGPNALGQTQISTLLTFVKSSALSNRFSEYGTKCTADNPHLVEVPLVKYADEVENINAFDMCFEAETKDGKHVLVVLFNSIPIFDSKIRKWMTSDVTFKKVKKQ